MYRYVALFHAHNDSNHVQNSPPRLNPTRPSPINPLEIAKNMTGNPMVTNAMLHNARNRLLTRPDLKSGLIGRTIRHIGTSSNAPISAVAKLIIDMRHRPMKAAEMVTDFKTAQLVPWRREENGEQPGIVTKVIRRSEDDVVAQMMERFVGDCSPGT